MHINKEKDLNRLSINGLQLSATEAKTDPMLNLSKKGNDVNGNNIGKKHSLERIKIAETSFGFRPKKNIHRLVKNATAIPNSILETAENINEVTEGIDKLKARYTLLNDTSF